MVRDPVAASVQASRETAKIDIGIRGMHCASCVSTIERALAAVPGVTRAVVNLAAERGAVSYDPAVATPAALVEAIAETGYTFPSVASPAPPAWRRSKGPCGRRRGWCRRP
jgi:Cu+-exporting ATPase